MQNGSGRDSYISDNDGGFASPGDITRKLGKGSQFELGLRSYLPTGKKFFGRRRVTGVGAGRQRNDGGLGAGLQGDRSYD